MIITGTAKMTSNASKDGRRIKRFASGKGKVFSPASTAMQKIREEDVLKDFKEFKRNRASPNTDHPAATKAGWGNPGYHFSKKEKARIGFYKDFTLTRTGLL